MPTPKAKIGIMTMSEGDLSPGKAKSFQAREGEKAPRGSGGHRHGWDEIVSTIDGVLFALFSRHADGSRHDLDRTRYRGTDLATGFDLYVARVYGCSWLAFLVVCSGAVLVGLLIPSKLVATLVSFLHAGLPIVDKIPKQVVPRWQAALIAGVSSGLVCKRVTVWFGGAYLRWNAAARRAAIEHTLPGAVRYLRAIAAGTDDRRTLLGKVARQDAYGETARVFRNVLNKATLTGSLDTGLRMVARDTPSRDLLSPFLLKFREHGNQGADALQGYLRMESRMLSHRQARVRQRAADFLELLAELFIVLLVIPALLVIIITVMGVLAPGLSRTVATPLGNTTVRAVIVYASAGFVLVVGLGAAALVANLRPPGQARTAPARPRGLATLVSIRHNPTSAAVVLAPLAVLTGIILWMLGYTVTNVVLLGYVAYGLPVGVVAVHRARIDDAKDREIRDFVHAVSGHVSLGRPFSQAVKIVAREVDLGALQSDVDDLAFNLSLATGPHNGSSPSGETDEGYGKTKDLGGANRDVRAAALDRFVERVGTPLADQTIGLVTGALDVGSDAEEVFEALQEEVGRLYFERKQLQSAMLVYVAVGWTTALLVVGIVVAVNGYVLDGFSQLSSVSGTAVAIDPAAVAPTRDRHRFYLVTQSTMLSCGWFAGAASRGRYEALLHSAALVGICYVVFAGMRMI